MSETKNAQIKSTVLGREDHGIMTFFLHLDYGGAGQGYGGHAIGDKKNPQGFGTAAIAEVLDVLGVECWEKLPGTFCRARASNGAVHAIGHPLRDKWVDLKALSEELEGK